MSTLRVDAIRHNSATSDAITTHSDGTVSAKIIDVGGGQLSHRNKIINGAMMISQRGTSFDINTSSDYTMDRFQVVESGGITFDSTVTQDSSAPDGFRKSLKISPDTVETSMSDSENAMIQTKLEGQDCQDFAFGTSSAKKVSISFYAKSGSQNNNHQYTLQIRKYDDSGNRNMVNRAFTVTTSWQRYTMTFDGDTAENIVNTNALGMQIIWHLATGPSDIHGASTTFGRTVNNSLYSGVTGQSNFLDNTNNEFYLTGCQIEVGDTATSFEHLSVSENKRRCYRYCQRGRHISSCLVGTPGTYYFSRGYINLFTPMRATISGTLKAATWNSNRYFKYMTWSSETNVTAAPASVTFSSLNISDASSDIVGLQLHISISSGSSNSPLPANGPGSNNVYPIEYFDVLLEAEL